MIEISRNNFSVEYSAEMQEYAYPQKTSVRNKTSKTLAYKSMYTISFPSIELIKTFKCMGLFKLPEDEMNFGKIIVSERMCSFLKNPF